MAAKWGVARVAAAMAQWFVLSIQEYSGSLVNYRGLVTWQPQQWLGIGPSHDYFRTNLDLRKRDFNGSVDWSCSGPQLFLNIGSSQPVRSGPA